MRLVFISSVTAMMPLRTISVTTGSALRFLLLFLAMLSALLHRSVAANSARSLSPTGRGLGCGGKDVDGATLRPHPDSVAPLRIARNPTFPRWGEVAQAAPPSNPLARSCHRDHEIAIGIDLQRVAWRQEGGRRVLLDQSRSFDAVAGEERGAPVR